MNKTAIYIRVSTDKQTEESQIQPCIDFCEEKGYDIIAEPFVDFAKSAYKNVYRPKYTEILNLVKQRKIQHIVVWALDRWTRRGTEELKDTINYLKIYGVQLHSVQEQWLEQLNIPGGIGIAVKDFLMGVSAWMAQEESKRISERVKGSARFQKAKDDGTVGRPKISEFVRQKVIELLNAGKSYSYIHDHVTYKVKYGKVKHISIFTISGIKSSLEKGDA